MRAWTANRATNLDDGVKNQRAGSRRTFGQVRQMAKVVNKDLIIGPQLRAAGNFMKSIKAGIIGTGFIGPAHVEAARRVGFVEMIALCEANDELARTKARRSASRSPTAVGKRC